MQHMYTRKQLAAAPNQFAFGEKGDKRGDGNELVIVIPALEVDRNGLVTVALRDAHNNIFKVQVKQLYIVGHQFAAKTVEHINNPIKINWLFRCEQGVQRRRDDAVGISDTFHDEPLAQTGRDEAKVSGYIVKRTMPFEQILVVAPFV